MRDLQPQRPVLILPFIEQQNLFSRMDANSAMSPQNTGYCCSYQGNTAGTVQGNPANNAFIVSQDPPISAARRTGPATAGWGPAGRTGPGRAGTG